MLSFKFIFGLLLVAIALGVGIIASVHNVRNARGPKERAFVLRACVVIWIVVLSMLACMYFLPSPYRYIALFVYLVISPILIYRWSTTHQLIRLLEQRDMDETPSES
jgi:peptidoglycan/LPS O-acetylase OafA/YrhL